MYRVLESLHQLLEVRDARLERIEVNLLLTTRRGSSKRVGGRGRTADLANPLDQSDPFVPRHHRVGHLRIGGRGG